MNDQPKTVLIAEDELLVRMVAVEIFEDAGFEVIEADHAEQALAALKYEPPTSIFSSPISTCPAAWTVWT
jgi:CheY-like chemotaxis protein